MEDGQIATDAALDNGLAAKATAAAVEDVTDGGTAKGGGGGGEEEHQEGEGDEENEEEEGGDDDDDDDDDDADDEEPRKRPSRARKKVVRLATLSKAPKEVKEIETPKGTGVTLGSLDNIKYNLDKLEAAHATVKFVHELCYGREGKKQGRKKRIREFCGWEEGSGTKEKVHGKVTDNKKKFTMVVLKNILSLLDLERGGNRDALVDRLATYLDAPADQGKKSIKDKKEEEKAKRVAKAERKKAKREKLEKKRAREKAKKERAKAKREKKRARSKSATRKVGSGGGSAKKKRKTSSSSSSSPGLSALQLFGKAYKKKLLAKDKSLKGNTSKLVTLIKSKWASMSDEEKYEYQVEADGI